MASRPAEVLTDPTSATGGGRAESAGGLLKSLPSGRACRIVRATDVSHSDAIVVLNAGSPSLKFAVYSRRAPQGLNLEAREQIEGLDTSPRFKAAGHDGPPLPAPPLTTGGRTYGHPAAFAFLTVDHGNILIPSVPEPSALTLSAISAQLPIRRRRRHRGGDGAGELRRVW
jgi:hypothetical protein